LQALSGFTAGSGKCAYIRKKNKRALFPDYSFFKRRLNQEQFFA